ncbi:MAG TPA: winged helix DNA-binding domain-containing protein [Actinoplanes sp.]
MSSLLLREHAAGRPTDVAGIVTWFGAMQAQDIASGMWSLGVRLPGWGHADVQAALDRLEAIRTWPMRGTIHFVPPRDAHWMLDLMGVRPLAAAAARRATVGLSLEEANRGVEVLGAALAERGRLTRGECLKAFADGGVAADGQRGYHLLWYASQLGVSCIAAHVGTEQTFMLLDDVAPDPNRPDRDEALGIIALRYFRSHGPTTRKDFVGWTGLTATDAKRGIAVAGDDLTTVGVDDVEMIVDPALLGTAPPDEPVDDIRVLPGFDEYLLGFKDRAMMVDAAHRQAIIPGNNGVFRSTVVRAGRVIATWKRTLTKRNTVVDVSPLVPLTAADRSRIESALQPYADFIGLPPLVRWD